MEIIDYLTQMVDLAADGDTQGVFFWAAAYALLVLLFSLIFQIRVSSWPNVIGRLTTNGITEFGHDIIKSDKEYKASVSYSYKVDGTEYTGKRLSPWIFITNHNTKAILTRQLKTIKRHADDGVIVYYDPRKPQKSYLILPGTIGKWVTGILAVLPLILYYFKYYS